METTYKIVDQPGQSNKRGGVFIKYKIIAFVAVVVIVVAISLVLLAAFLGPGRENSGSEECDHSSSGKPQAFAADQTTQLSCDVAIVGGGISGLYVAETLLRLHKETNVCLFEREDRFGGRILDHIFPRMPGVPVSLGAWRVDKSNSLVWELLKRFNISVSYLAKDHHDRLEARGIFATNRLTLKNKAFPSLNHGRFENATYEQMLGYFFSQRKEADKFASFSDFVSEYLTPEGFQLFSHLSGYLSWPNNERQISARSILDFSKALAQFKENFTRPESGLSTITKALKMSATNLGAKLYKNEEIKVIQETKGNKFKLITTNYTATANKLVVAVPPKPMKHIKGSVAEKIQNDSAFETIEFLVGFKGVAVFEEAWWQHNSTGSRYLADEQLMISTSDCLGFIFPYKQRGLKGEAVLQMSYTSWGCAVKWGKLLKISKESVDREMNRALQRLFPGVEIPKPLDSVYVYWDEGMMHFQRAGTHLSSFKLSDWAKRPFTGQDLFIVGEAYQPLRGWIEGALQSAQNTLREGWGIENYADLKQRRELKQNEAIKDNFDWILFP